jgi:hypothetical protein
MAVGDFARFFARDRGFNAACGLHKAAARVWKAAAFFLAKQKLSR